jgi:hypothetical protein
MLKKKREGIESCFVLFAPLGWLLIFASHLNFEFNRAKNLNRTWVDLGLLELVGEFRENWEGIQMPFIQVIFREVNLK